mmetsp:Transcript_14180/g.53279  ORF Transcript_14180/g.53279 Transcript_14180/m.53279 type:complete len:211 (-) Transcript_14180:106-738(-)
MYTMRCRRASGRKCPWRGSQARSIRVPTTPNGRVTKLRSKRKRCRHRRRHGCRKQVRGIVPMPSCRRPARTPRTRVPSRRNPATARTLPAGLRARGQGRGKGRGRGSDPRRRRSGVRRRPRVRLRRLRARGKLYRRLQRSRRRRSRKGSRPKERRVGAAARIWKTLRHPCCLASETCEIPEWTYGAMDSCRWGRQQRMWIESPLNSLSRA